MRELLKALTLCALGLAPAMPLIACAITADNSTYELQATTVTGDLYVAGSGSSCGEAKRNAVMPKAIVIHIACKRV